MTFDMLAGKAAPTTFVQWLIGTALVAVVGAALLMLICAVTNGPKMRAMAESRKAEEIGQEDRAFCAKLGMNFGAPAFATCANVLGQIRRLEEERFNRDSSIL
jgi:hypothetical protein